ncbi:MAG: hypothetical protein AB7L84_14360 [Acidimicrobiia bacterium]
MSVALPQDVQAEQDLAAVAVMSCSGALAAVEVAGEVYDPRVRRIIDTAVGLPEGLEVDERVEMVAQTAGVPAIVLSAWVAACPVMFDTSRALRQRVHLAAINRERALALAAELEDLVGAPVEFAAPGWSERPGSVMEVSERAA